MALDVPVLISAWIAFLLWATGELVLAGGSTTASRLWQRRVWLLGAAALSLHVALAFGRVHAWSHTAAVEATARQLREQMGVGWGGGVFINYLLVAWWWGDVATSGVYPTRWNQPGAARTIRRAVFWFLWFNGAVVFAFGYRRAVAAILCLAVLAVWWRLGLRQNGRTTPIVQDG